MDAATACRACTPPQVTSSALLRRPSGCRRRSAPFSGADVEGIPRFGSSGAPRVESGRHRPARRQIPYRGQPPARLPGLEGLHRRNRRPKKPGMRRFDAGIGDSRLIGSRSAWQFPAQTLQPRCRGCGGIGRRTRFRIWRREAWGFKSLHPHQAPSREFTVWK